MARKPAPEEAAPDFNYQDQPGFISLRYQVSLITPMAGGGSDSWVPDIYQPVRSQSVKGQLRFWWRSMQPRTTPHELFEAERALWGGSGIQNGDEETASTVRIHVNHVSGDRRPLRYQDLENELPDYVLFPMAMLSPEQQKLWTDLSFELALQVPENHREEVEDTVRLWILFGGLGARTSRGCGSLFCKEVMDGFQQVDDIVAFWRGFQNREQSPFGDAGYPSIINSRLGVSLPANQTEPRVVWNNLLFSFKTFRQGPGTARNRGQGNRPGRTFWPEADAIRRITGKHAQNHEPEHVAGNWFPRGAYGLPIQTEFKNADGDPRDKFFLQPTGKERWPSPVILKAVQLPNQACIKTCLMLNHAVPEDIELLQGQNTLHELEPDEHPMAYTSKIMPAHADMLHSGENPYDALFRHLDVEEVES
jgi:CRISPR-associated protein Cmr1